MIQTADGAAYLDIKMVTDLQMVEKRRDAGLDEKRFNRELILVLTIVQCEGGNVMIIKKGNKKYMFLKTEIPPSHWCDKCKRLILKVDEIEEQYAV